MHRIGQLGSVLVTHLVFDDSVDSIMAQTIISKQEVIEAAMDHRTKAVTGPAPAPQPAAESGLPFVKQLREFAAQVIKVKEINYPSDPNQIDEIPF